MEEIALSLTPLRCVPSALGRFVQSNCHCNTVKHFYITVHRLEILHFLAAALARPFRMTMLL